MPEYEPPTIDPDEHALVIKPGDEEFHAFCSCGRYFGYVRVDQSISKFERIWDFHTTEIFHAQGKEISKTLLRADMSEEAARRRRL